MSEHSARILVVEDEAVVLQTLQLILKQHGYEVRGARDGAEALAIATEFAPSILLCDINLPDMDGIQISLRVKDAFPACRIVLLSGEITSTELLEEAETRGYRLRYWPSRPSHNNYCACWREATDRIATPLAFIA